MKWIAFLFVVFAIQCQLIAGIQTEINNVFFSSTEKLPALKDGQNSELCNLSIWELGDGGLIEGKTPYDQRYLLLEHFSENCFNKK